MRESNVLAIVVAELAAPAALAGGNLSVVGVQPPAHALAAPVSSSIAVTFDQPVNPATVTPLSFWAFGRWSGPGGPGVGSRLRAFRTVAAWCNEYSISTRRGSSRAAMPAQKGRF